MIVRILLVPVILIALVFTTCPEASAAMDLDVERFVLENGLTVLHVKRDNLPVVRATLLIKSGASRETAKLSGLASLTAPKGRSPVAPPG
jgi:zinc protease